MVEILEPADSLNNMIKKLGMFGDKQKETINELKKMKPVEFLLPNEFRIHNESGFKLNLLKLDKSLTSQILIKSKQNKIKLSGYFNAIVFYALRDLYLENGLEFPKVVTCGNTANMRMRYNPNMSFSDMRFQVCITDLTLNQDNLSGDFWKDATYMHDKIQEITDIDIGILFLGSHDEEYLKNTNETFNKCSSLSEACEKLSKKNLSDLGLSNIGS